jgi:hypothetical protein
MRSARRRGTLNPKYVKGVHPFLNKQQLLSVALGGDYQISDRGQHRFMIFGESVIVSPAKADGGKSRAGLAGLVGRRKKATPTGVLAGSYSCTVGF